MHRCGEGNIYHLQIADLGQAIASPIRAHEGAFAEGTGKKGKEGRGTGAGAGAGTDAGIGIGIDIGAGTGAGEASAKCYSL